MNFPTDESGLISEMFNDPDSVGMSKTGLPVPERWRADMALTEEELRDLLELAEGGRPDGMGIKNKWIVRLIEEVRRHRAGVKRAGT